MSNAVTRIDLLDDGKRVNLHFSRWGDRTLTVNIRDIKKQVHEKTLLETYEESTMFPVKVGDKLYYINGSGQEAIKNGELFRAIING